MEGFVEFIRKQGVVGLAIGFLLGGAVSKIVASFVEDIVSPFLGLILGPVGVFTDLSIKMGESYIRIGSFISNLIDFIIICAIVYFVFRGLGLERLDKKRDK